MKNQQSRIVLQSITDDVLTEVQYNAIKHAASLISNIGVKATLNGFRVRYTNPKQMTEEEICELYHSETIESDWEGDNAMQGLVILSKYAQGEDVLVGADHDIIYSLNVSKTVEAGITEEDVHALLKLNWLIRDDTYWACFV